MGTAREAIEARLESKKQAKAKKTTSKDSKAKKEKAKKAKAKTEKENKAPAGTAIGKKAGPKKARKKAVMKWSSKENHIYTDNLLTLIEDTPRYAQAFGFTTKGDSAKNVSSSGQRPSDMYDEIARALFIDPEESTFDEDDLEQLSNAVKNRVSSFKSGFRTHRDALGQTGQGLVHGGNESEITPGSDLANVWGMYQCISFHFGPHRNPLLT
ncbi:hypothetical protein DFP72DRAFT_315644 [Ephemerocybe angulata]|uniref:Uncharacterized protein n=1 Tax=Ephemerocybe angulata TaxID=980116 RepID=A0A8H6H5Y0_9AGAR|nr:hypothetical protein DFP72DRAFT_315644 [Tulosesus angulatus]